MREKGQMWVHNSNGGGVEGIYMLSANEERRADEIEGILYVIWI